MAREIEIGLSALLAGLRRWGLEPERLTAAADDPSTAPVVDALRHARRGEYDEALPFLQQAAASPHLAGWSLLAQASVRLWQKEYRQATSLLEQAAAFAQDDPILLASVLHLQGAVRYHLADSEGALPLLERSLELLGPEHFLRGRVLDTLGMLYGQWNNFHASQAFYEAALKSKAAYGDESGSALSHGQLGRLFFSWGRWDAARSHFEEDLALARKLGDVHAQAVMHNALGRLDLARGSLALALGQEEDARRHLADALGKLREGIALVEDRFTVTLGLARKDVGLVLLKQGELDEAERELAAAAALFEKQEFAEGVAHVHLSRGMLHRQRGDFEQALLSLNVALKHFRDTKELPEAAQALLEIALTHRDAREDHLLVRRAFREALAEAERCRHPYLVLQIEQALKRADEAGYYQHLFHRVRGQSLSEETSSLVSGVREVVSILYLDLKGSTDFARQHDPEEVMLIINQMLHELTTVIQRQEGQVLSFRGDGFLALFRGEDHAGRAVEAGLDAEAALATFNRPRQILGLSAFVQRIGIATGEVVLGNVGTYHKMDFAGVGNPANLGARLESSAIAGYPCISQETRDLIGERFTYRVDSPRRLDLKGFGERAVWDVKAASDRYHRPELYPGRSDASDN